MLELTITIRKLQLTWPSPAGRSSAREEATGTYALKGCGLNSPLGKEYLPLSVLTSVEEVKNIARFRGLRTEAPGIIGQYRAPEANRRSVAG